MRFKHLINDNNGSLLVAVCSLGIISLGINGQLTLYIHPRYIVFTIIFGVIGLVLSAVSLKQGPGHANTKNSRAIRVMLPLALLAFSLLLLSPATLSTNIAGQRGLNDSDTLDTTSSAKSLAKYSSTNFNGLSVKDLSSLLKQTNDPGYLTNKDLKVSGFIIPDEEDPENVFYASRFVLTCCAVDATPVGIGVYSPGWRANFQQDQWIEVSGQFKDIQHEGASRFLVTPSSLVKIDEPRQPYDY